MWCLPAVRRAACRAFATAARQPPPPRKTFSLTATLGPLKAQLKHHREAAVRVERRMAAAILAQTEQRDLLDRALMRATHDAHAVDCRILSISFVGAPLVHDGTALEAHWSMVLVYRYRWHDIVELEMRDDAAPLLNGTVASAGWDPPAYAFGKSVWKHLSLLRAEAHLVRGLRSDGGDY
jgi:hypothetical protein